MHCNKPQTFKRWAFMARFPFPDCTITKFKLPLYLCKSFVFGLCAQINSFNNFSVSFREFFIFFNAHKKFTCNSDLAIDK
nr:MAG TPA: hypothetical protein [Bacteriophage sp.]